LPKVISEKSLLHRASSAAGVRNNKANGFIYAITFGDCSNHRLSKRGFEKSSIDNWDSNTYKRSIKDDFNGATGFD
jgi:hypothetical protein